ncbi:MAG: hypothetical protein ACLFTE_02600 [Salinivenus sp.]
MPYIRPHADDWVEVDSSPNEAPYIEISEAPPEVHIIGASDTYSLSGAPVDPSADTIHTLAVVNPDTGRGSPLCAVYVQDRTLDVEDRRPPDSPPAHADAVDRLRSALDEILIPVYIDDALHKVSQGLDDALLLHTVQYDDGPEAAPTYFRVSAVQKDTLQFELERGAL